MRIPAANASRYAATCIVYSREKNMNNNFRASNDSSILAERLFNALSVYMDVVDLAEFVATNPSMQEIADKLAELKEKNSQGSKNPYGLPFLRKRWVTDRLDSKGHKIYRQNLP